MLSITDGVLSQLKRCEAGTQAELLVRAAFSSCLQPQGLAELQAKISQH